MYVAIHEKTVYYTANFLSMIERAESFLGPQKGIEQVYAMLNETVPLQRSFGSYSFQETSMWSGQYILCGLEYLANRFDGYVETVSTAAWQAVAHEVVEIRIVEDMQKTAVEWLHFDSAFIDRLIINEDELYVLNRSIKEVPLDRSIGYVQEFCVVLGQPEFVHRAQRHPLQALASTAVMASLVRDYFNCRLAIDMKPEVIKERAEAFMAYMLLRAKDREPALTFDHEQTEIVNKYPQGIFTRVDESGALYYYTKDGTNCSKPSLS